MGAIGGIYNLCHMDICCIRVIASKITFLMVLSDLLLPFPDEIPIPAGAGLEPPPVRGGIHPDGAETQAIPLTLFPIVDKFLAHATIPAALEAGL